ncbi:MAG: hypothetical protein WCP28_01500 [Actinomycetes bacterium]
MHIDGSNQELTASVGSSLRRVGRTGSATSRRVVCAVAVSGAVLLAPAALVAAVPTSVSAAVVQMVPQSTSGDLAAAKAQLADAAKAVQAADAAASAEASKLPAANKALADAEAAVAAALAAKTAALAAQVTADQQAAAAQQQVQDQRERVTVAQKDVDAIRDKIAVLAREAYISGGQSTELLILLDTKDPLQFAEQLVALRRISQENLDLFTKAAALEAELRTRLDQLRVLQDAAQARAQDAAARAQDAASRATEEQSARDAAQSSRQQIADLVAAKQAGLAQALATRKRLKDLYDSLQAKLLAESRVVAPHGTTTSVGTAHTVGTGRTAKEALDWGMQWVGSGAEYDGMCLGFVDDAFSPRGGRVGTAIEQWYRAKAAGYGHPGDRNPPIGAQVFWWTGVPARHIAIYAGGGMVLTTGASGGLVGLMSMDDLDGWGPYIGWATAYYG